MQKLIIHNLEQFIDALNACGHGFYQFNDVARSVAISLSDVEPYVSWNSESYTRNIISKNEDYELLLLCWEPGQRTEIHDHNGQEGWIQIIQGQLTEERFVLNESDAVPRILTSDILNVHELSNIRDDIGLHRISNNTMEKSISLHLYVKPVESVNYYNEENGEVTSQSLKSKIVNEYE